MASIALADCPVGLFITESGTLCLKTEYGNNEGRIDAYIVSSGEFFWGSQPQTIENQRRQMVTPVDVDVRPLVKCWSCDGVGFVDDDNHCPGCKGRGWRR